jgi:hypothetical protein
MCPSVGERWSRHSCSQKFPIDEALRQGTSDVVKYLLQESYASISDHEGRLPLHALLEDSSTDGTSLGKALEQNVLSTDDVSEIIAFLVGRDSSTIMLRNDAGETSLHVACRCGSPFETAKAVVRRHTTSVQCVTPQGDLPLFLACATDEPSLDVIYLLLKLYPDVVYL